MMKRYRCVVAYEGAAYDGWQSQRKGISVQEQIEGALHQVAHQKINIVCAGRTDAGVNAWGQVFHFDSDMNLSARKWMGAMNGSLPKDIRIRSVTQTDTLFHARYCVRAKQYDYRINLGEYNVFTRNQAYQSPVKLDLAAMKQASRCLIGRHDFSSFSANTLRETPDQVRTLRSVRFRKRGDELTISYVGRGFLRYMVRMITGELIEVGQGRQTPEAFAAMLAAHSKTVCRHKAVPQGLTLVRVDYFAMIAADQKTVVREFLPDEHLPFDWQLEDLEQRCRRHRVPRAYAVAQRNGHQLLGWLTVYRPRRTLQAELCVLSPAQRPAAEALLPQLNAWLARQKGTQRAVVTVTAAENAVNRLSQAQ